MLRDFGFGVERNQSLCGVLPQRLLERTSCPFLAEPWFPEALRIYAILKLRAGFYRLPAAGGLFGKKERGNVGVFGKGVCGWGVW